MALGRTYYTETDKLEADTATTTNHARAALWMFGSFLCGLISGTAGRTGAIPAGARWSVFGSSDGVTAGLDGDARGLVGATFDPAKWPRAAAGSAHAWLVLSKAIGGVTYYLVLDYVGTLDYQITWRLIQGTAPTGGSVTAAPTVSDDASFVGHTFIGNAAAAGGIRGFITMDADGHFTFGFKQAGEDVGKIATTVWAWWDVDDKHASDTRPWFILADHNASAGAMKDTTAALTSTGGATSGGVLGRSKTSGGQVGCVLAVLGGNASVFSKLGGGQDYIRTNDPAQPTVGVWIITAGQSGRRGDAPDWRCGADKGDGHADPSAAAIERCLVGSFYLPMMGIPSTS